MIEVNWQGPSFNQTDAADHYQKKPESLHFHLNIGSISFNAKRSIPTQITKGIPLPGACNHTITSMLV